MLDQALVWNTDLSLRVTSLTARLRGFAGIGSGPNLHVSDLWSDAEGAAAIVAAHRWALQGEALSFEAVLTGARYHIEILPLYDPEGIVIGAGGRAVQLHDAARPAGPAPLDSAERYAGMGSWHEDLRTGAVVVSDGLRALLRITPETRTLDIRAYDHPGDRSSIAETLGQYAGEDAYVCDHRILCRDSRVRFVRERVRVLHDERGVPIGRIGTLVDISDLKEREAQLAELALCDALTRLPNRTALRERLESAIARCQRNDWRCAVLFIDLDNFKAINDTHGHAYGDSVLAAVADRLVRNLRASDMVARLAGDEFVVVIDDVYTDDGALDAGRKLMRTLEEPLAIGDELIHVRASIGISLYPNGGTDAHTLLECADREMYEVKRSGGRGVRLGTRKESITADAEMTERQARSSPVPRPFAILENV